MTLSLKELSQTEDLCQHTWLERSIMDTNTNVTLNIPTEFKDIVNSVQYDLFDFFWDEETDEFNEDTQSNVTTLICKYTENPNLYAFINFAINNQIPFYLLTENTDTYEECCTVHFRYNNETYIRTFSEEAPRAFWSKIETVLNKDPNQDIGNYVKMLVKNNLKPYQIDTHNIFTQDAINNAKIVILQNQLSE